MHDVARRVYPEKSNLGLLFKPIYITEELPGPIFQVLGTGKSVKYTVPPTAAKYRPFLRKLGKLGKAGFVSNEFWILGVVTPNDQLRITDWWHKGTGWCEPGLVQNFWPKEILKYWLPTTVMATGSMDIPAILLRNRTSCITEQPINTWRAKSYRKGELRWTILR